MRDDDEPDVALELTQQGSALRVSVSLGLATGHLTRVEFVMPKRDALVSFMKAMQQIIEKDEELGAMLAIALDRRG